MIVKLEVKLPDYFDDPHLHAEDMSDMIRETVADAYSISSDDVKIVDVVEKIEEHTQK